LGELHRIENDHRLPLPTAADELQVLDNQLPADFMSDATAADIVVLEHAGATLEARIDAAGRLAHSDERRAWDSLFDLANDHELPRALSLAVGISLARMAHRLRQPPGALIRGEDENFLLRDFSEAAFEGYDTTAADLERERPTGR